MVSYQDITTLYDVIISDIDYILDRYSVSYGDGDVDVIYNALHDILGIDDDDDALDEFRTSYIDFIQSSWNTFVPEEQQLMYENFIDIQNIIKGIIMRKNKSV